MQFSLNHIRRFRVSTLVALLATAVCWCGFLGVIDNEADSTLGFIQRYFQLRMFLWYGVPVMLSGFWIVSRLEQRGYSQTSALRWAVPLSCLLGTAIALVFIAGGLGWYVLMNGGLR